MAAIRYSSVLLFLSLVSAYQLAQPVNQLRSLENRATYNGGWALGIPGSTCPAIAPVACWIASGGLNPNCCPEGQRCSDTTYPYCCPSSAECLNTARNFPVCANSTWNMYHIGTNDAYFCCEPGQFGVIPAKGVTGICLPLDQPVASSMTATAASQYGGGAVVTVSGVSKTPLSTKTVTSSLADGGLTVVTTTIGAAATASSSSSNGNGNGNTGSSNGGSSGGLSLGAKIGIAIGAAVLFLAAVFFAWRWNRSSRLLREQQATLARYQGQVPGYTPASPQPPLQEYKSPAVGVQGGGYVSQIPPPASDMAQRETSPMLSTEYGAASPPVEAPGSRWERRAEMGEGR